MRSVSETHKDHGEHEETAALHLSTVMSCVPLRVEGDAPGQDTCDAELVNMRGILEFRIEILQVFTVYTMSVSSSEFVLYKELHIRHNAERTLGHTA